MRAARALIIAAIVLGAARLFTGIVYEQDAPIAALVIKMQPALAIERTATPDYPVSADVLLDREEPQLVYAPAYLALMTAAPLLVIIAAGTALWLGRRYRRA